jgi:hypothetical protein
MIDAVSSSVKSTVHPVATDPDRGLIGCGLSAQIAMKPGALGLSYEAPNGTFEANSVQIGGEV